MHNLSKSKIFLICCLVFIIGIAVASFSPIYIVQNDLWWFIGVVGFIVVLILFWSKQKIGITALIGLFLFLGLWRYAVGLPANTPDKVWYYNGQAVTVIGVVANEPDLRQKNQKLEIEIYSVGIQDVETQNFASLRNVSGKILITTNLYPIYNYGDELKITVLLGKSTVNNLEFL